MRFFIVILLINFTLPAYPKTKEFAIGAQKILHNLNTYKNAKETEQAIRALPAIYVSEIRDRDNLATLTALIYEYPKCLDCPGAVVCGLQNLALGRRYDSGEDCYAKITECGSIIGEDKCR